MTVRTCLVRIKKRCNILICWIVVRVVRYAMQPLDVYLSRTTCADAYDLPPRLETAIYNIGLTVSGSIRESSVASRRKRGRVAFPRRLSAGLALPLVVTRPLYAFRAEMFCWSN